MAGCEEDGVVLADLRVVELKLELERRGLDRNGVKSALVDRLEQAMVKEGLDPLTHRFEYGDGMKKPRGSTPSKRAEDDSGKATEPVEGTSASAEPEDAPTAPDNDDDVLALSDQTGQNDDELNLSIEEEEKLIAEEENTADEALETNGTAAEEENGVTRDAENMVPAPEDAPVLAPLTVEDTLAIKESGPPAGDQASLIVNVGELDDTKTANGSEETEKASPGNNEGGPASEEKKPEAAQQDGTEDAPTAAASNKGKSVATPTKEGGKDGSSVAAPRVLNTSRPSLSARNIWVSGLSSQTRATDLKTLFSKYGKVIGAKIVTNAKAPGTRCYGFVTMSSLDEVSRCIQHLNRTELHGRVISVDRVRVWAKSEPVTSTPKKSGAKSAAATTAASKEAARAPRERKESASKSTEKTTASPAKTDGASGDGDSAAVKKDDEGGEGDEKKKEDGKTEGKTKSEDDDSKKDAERKAREERMRRIRERRLRQPPPSASASRGRFSSLRRPAYRGRISSSGYPRPFHRPYPYSSGGIRPRGIGGVRGAFLPAIRRPPYRGGGYGSSFMDRSRLLAMRRFAGDRYGDSDRDRRRQLELVRAREIDRRQREEAFRIEREKERLRMERERLERDKLEVLRFEREKQRAERERLERERDELRRRQITSRYTDTRRGIKRTFDSRERRDSSSAASSGGAGSDYWSDRKRQAIASARFDATRGRPIASSAAGFDRTKSDRFERRDSFTSSTPRGGGLVGRRPPPPPPERRSDPRYERSPRAPARGGLPASRDGAWKNSAPADHHRSVSGSRDRYDSAKYTPSASSTSAYMSSALSSSSRIDSHSSSRYTAYTDHRTTAKGYPSSAVVGPSSAARGGHWSERSAVSANKVEWSSGGSSSAEWRGSRPPSQALYGASSGAAVPSERYDSYKSSASVRRY